jgi:hypothetical protein
VALFVGADLLHRPEKVMPPVLRRLARHSNITTTLAYYVDNSDAVADELWAQHAGQSAKAANPGNRPGVGNTSGNNGPETTLTANEPHRL